MHGVDAECDDREWTIPNYRRGWVMYARPDGIYPAHTSDRSAFTTPSIHAMNKRIQKKKIRQLVLVELAQRFQTTEDAVAWLEQPHAELENRTPREAISAGDADRVAVLLEGMNRQSAG
jgi:hypothetical protein